MVAFETVTLDMATMDFPTSDEIRSLRGRSLTGWIESGVAAVAASVGKPADTVRSRLVKTVDIKPNREPDEDDLRECLRVLRVWINDPAACVPPARRPKVTRPEGIGQLPVPRTVKAAHLEISCGLCGDPVKAGELIGRAKDPKGPAFEAMGWLCGHCLYQRRETPRRRDVLLRIHHHLFAGSAVGLNAYECGVLHTWLTEDPALPATPAWVADPLEATLARLRTSVQESKGTTWVATPTARTIAAVLTSSSTASPAESALLGAITQHIEEWATNPAGVDHRRFGTGTPYRTQVLRTTPRPTLLSARGGPFDLHQTPASAAEPDTTSPEAEAADHGV
ncbi:hypothetical protein [Streptomyces cyaneofuscatus]|uniref:hypothetical protein n=1 Tax=Streptomyces cyaneofuscatus TaxID=66883 RepID=UPI0037BB0E4B